MSILTDAPAERASATPGDIPLTLSPAMIVDAYRLASRHPLLVIGLLADCRHGARSLGVVARAKYELAEQVLTGPLHGPEFPDVPNGCTWCSAVDAYIDFHVSWDRSAQVAIDGDEFCCSGCLDQVVEHAETDPFRVGRVECDELDEDVAA